MSDELASMFTRVRRWFGSPRSAGQRVSTKTRRSIAAADRARGAGDWGGAAALYAGVLEKRPDLVHLRVQLGHMLKEAGQHDAAAAEYRRALDAAPAYHDAALHLAHAVKRLGRRVEATDIFVELALRNPDDEEAMREARDLLGSLPTEARQTMAAKLSRNLGFVQAPDTSASDPPGHSPSVAECDIVFDAADLISFFSHSRRPTGIQRVQIEVLTQALRRSADRPAAAACCFIDGRDCWVEIPSAALLDLMRLSGAFGPANDPQWRRQRDALHLHLLVGEPVDFRDGATLVNLGTSWWLHNYFLRLRDMQARRGIVYIPMIHDMIPVVLPEFCLQPLVRDFVAWATGVFDHSRTFLANSQATKRDLIACAADLGYAIDPAAVKIVRLDALPASADRASAEIGETALPEAIGDQSFVLFVATIEPRKGHLVAFEAWERLTKELGAATPLLVCVGRNGWHSEAILDRLTRSEVLANRILLLENLDQVTLTTLYSQCLFAIYPSFYEGWGLPVTEALACGRPVITTDVASLPEAGGSLAIYVPPGDAVALSDAAARLVLNHDERNALAAAIARDFVPCQWADIARDVTAAAIDLRRSVAKTHRTSAPKIPLDQFVWLGRSMAVCIHPGATNGEGFRAGQGWGRLEDWGCRVAVGGGRLACSPPSSYDLSEGLVAAVRIVGLKEAPCSFNVGGITGELAPGERRTVFCPVAIDHAQVSIDVAGVIAPTAICAIDDDTTVGVEGFAIHKKCGDAAPKPHQRATSAPFPANPIAMQCPPRPHPALPAALRTLDVERSALEKLRATLAEPPLASAFDRAADLIAASAGRVVVTGMGKSGLVGRKIAATLASTGTPAFYIHPADASHGDLGMITGSDIVLAFSWSGETAELSDVIAYCQRFGVPLIAATSQPTSTLAVRADIVLALPQVEEACPNRLAPTSSTIVQAAIGDALAVALIEVRGFSSDDFRIFHPKGRLGAQLLRVGDIMASGAQVPIVTDDATILTAMVEMSSKRFGITAVVNGAGELTGAFTDGDLRRGLTDGSVKSRVYDHMNPRPSTIDADRLAIEALAIMNLRSITQLFVHENGKLAGILHLHDILRAGIV